MKLHGKGRLHECLLSLNELIPNSMLRQLNTQLAVNSEPSKKQSNTSSLGTFSDAATIYNTVKLPFNDMPSS